MSRWRYSGSRKVQSILLVGLLCCSVLASAGVAAAGPSDVYVTVSDVAVSEAEPETGDTVTVTPTITHSGEFSGGFHITEIELVAPDGTVVSGAEDVGAIGSGESLDVPLRTSFETAGEKRLRVTVRGLKEDADGHLQRVGYIERPVYVSVSEPSSDSATPPRVHLDVGRAVAGTDVPVTVTVSNGDDEEISDLFLRLDGVHGNVEAETRIQPSLGAGNLTSFTFHVTPEEAVETTLRATLYYGDDESVKAFQPVQVASLRENVDVYASVLERNESPVLQYRVTNQGNAPIHDVAISGTAGDTALPGATVDTVDASSAETVTIPVSSTLSGAAAVEASYTVDGHDGQAERTVALSGSTTGASHEVEATQSLAAPTDGVGVGNLPFSVVGVALAGLASVAVVGYRRWEP
jgi:hypothetical protein